MFTKAISTKFNVLCNSLLGDDSTTDNVYLPLYTYNEQEINSIFSKFHESCNALVAELRERVNIKNNTYLTSSIRTSINNIYEKINQLKGFFSKNNFDFYFNKDYDCLFSLIVSKAKQLGIHSYLDETIELPELVIDEPLFVCSQKNSFKNIEYLIFGASKTKPDIVIKDVLDANLSILNDNDVLVYTDKIEDSLVYSDFKNWWQKNNKKYQWYKPENQMNEIELKVQNFYKENYGQDDSNPVLIPQVYLHYDPKNKGYRQLSKIDTGLKFQRMDFLILYKGKRVIIEIDGKEHFENAEEYSKQCKYDRDMKFLGYDVFRLGGYELTHNFDETIKKFFINLFNYIDKA